VDGAKGAALPLIRHDLGLSYEQVGLLASVPLLVGGFLELPMGVLAGQGRRRRLVILGGGVVFLLTLLAVASAGSFAVLMAAFVAFYPASGAFVSLTQAEIMDAWPGRQAQVAVAALAIAVRLGAALAGDAALIVILERVGDLTVLRVSAAAAALLYPGFLLVPGVLPKLAVLAALSAVTAPWYPVLQARLYGSLPGRSSVAVTLSSAAGLAGGLGPLAVGLAAEGFGLSWALAGLVIVPAAVLLIPGRAKSPDRVRA
jgi:MFS family permease